jgi:hypothetical protein
MLLGEIVGIFFAENRMMRVGAESGKMRCITARASGTYSCQCASNERGLPCLKSLLSSLLTRGAGLNPRLFHVGVLVGKVTQAFLCAFLCSRFIIPPLCHVFISRRRYKISEIDSVIK